MLLNFCLDNLPKRGSTLCPGNWQFVMTNSPLGLLSSTMSQLTERQKDELYGLCSCPPLLIVLMPYLLLTSTRRQTQIHSRLFALLWANAFIRGPARRDGVRVYP